MMPDPPTLIAIRYTFALDHTVTIRDEKGGLMRTALAHVTWEPAEISVIFENLSPGRADRQSIISVSTGGSVSEAQKKLQEALNQFLIPEVIESPTSKPLPPAQLVGALHDRVHVEVGRSRPAKVVRVRSKGSSRPLTE